MLQFGWETGLQLILNVVVLSELFQVVCYLDFASRTQMWKPSGTGCLLSKSQEVLSVLRQVFSGGRYRRIFGILPQIRLCLTSCQAIAVYFKQNTKNFQAFSESRQPVPEGFHICCSLPNLQIQPCSCHMNYSDQI